VDGDVAVEIAGHVGVVGGAQGIVRAVKLDEGGHQRIYGWVSRRLVSVSPLHDMMGECPYQSITVRSIVKPSRIVGKLSATEFQELQMLGTRDGIVGVAVGEHEEDEAEEEQGGQ
jgi:hypothetical protein